MRKFISIILTLLLVFNTLITAFGASDIMLKIDNNTMTVGENEVQLDTAPVIINGRTLIPVRGMSEAMGADVDWDNTDKTVTITKENVAIKLTIDSTTAYLNNEEKTLDTAPVILNGRTMLPARFIAESFGYDVTWDNDNKTILVTYKNNETTVATTTETTTEVTTVEKTENTGKSLIVYFSKTGTTERVANEIKNITGADIVKVEPVTPYPENYNETVDIASREKEKNARPEIKVDINNLDDYDTIYIGYPIWWGTMPMAMFTFIENYDLSNKTIIPFSTHQGSGLGSSVSDLKKALPKSNIKKGLAANSSTTTDEIENWIESIKD